MSIHEVVVPDIGDSRDVEVSELLVASGAVVAVGDALLVLESDKASVEVTADVAGTVASFMVAPGAKVEQGQVLVRIETGAAPTAPAPAAAAAPVAAAAAAPQPSTAVAPPVAATVPTAVPTPVATTVSATAEGAATAEVSVLVPDIGDAKNVVVSELLVAAGARVSKGQALVVLESDKSSMEIEATVDGVLLRFGVAPGDEVAMGAVIAVLGGAASAVTIKALGGLMDNPQDISTAQALETYGFALLP